MRDTPSHGEVGVGDGGGVLGAVLGDGGVEQSCPWTAGIPRPVMVLLVVSTFRLCEMSGSRHCVG